MFRAQRSKVRVIEDVEGLSSQLNSKTFSDRQNLGHSEVHALGWWPIHRFPWRVAQEYLASWSGSRRVT
jgi:hypothetical protein